MPLHKSLTLAVALAAATFASSSWSRPDPPSLPQQTLRAAALGPVRPLSLVAGSPSAQPQLAVTSDGRVALSWLEKTGEPSQHAFKYAFRQGDGWTAPRTIVERDSFFVNWADVPSIFAVAGRGGLIAHWLQKNGRGTYAYDVRMAMSDPQAQQWSGDFLPYIDRSETEHGFASFFDWPGGGTGAVWLDGREMKPGAGHDGHDAGAMTLRVARIGADGKISDESKVDGRVCECCPTAAVGTSRGALLAYRDRSETEVRDIAVMRLENGKWLGPTYVHEDKWLINACPVNGPALASSGDRVALAWFTAQGDVPRAMLAFSTDAGKSFGKPVRVDESQTLGRVDAVLLDDGRAVVSWLEVVPGGSELRARVVGSDGTRSPHIVIAASTSDRQSGYPRMVRAGREIVFAWTATRPVQQVKVAVISIE